MASKVKEPLQRHHLPDEQWANHTLAFPETGFLRLPDVLKFIPVSKATWWNWVKVGKAPESVKLSERVTVWRAEDIRALINELGGAA